MPTTEAERIRLIAELARRQRGMLTSTQTTAAGVFQTHLTAMVRAGVLERIHTGVYRLSWAPPDPHAHARGLWMAMDLTATLDDRLARPHAYGAVSHYSAAHLHALTDSAPPVDQVTPASGKTFKYSAIPPRRAHAVVRDLAPADVTVVDDIAVTVIGRTLRDLIGTAAAITDEHLTLIRRALQTGVDPHHLSVHLTPVFAGRAATALSGDRWIERMFAAAGHHRPSPLLAAGWRPQYRDAQRRAITADVLAQALDALAHPLDTQPPPPSTSKTVSIAHEHLTLSTIPDPADGTDLAVGDHDGHGLYGTLDDDGTTVLCHECGKRFVSIGTHLRHSGHGLTARQYKIKHGLTLSTPLNTKSHSAKLSTSIAAVMTPDVMDKIRERVDQTTAAERRRQSRTEYSAPLNQIGGRQRLNAQIRRDQIWTCAVCEAQWCLLSPSAARATCSDTCRTKLILSNKSLNPSAVADRDTAVRQLIRSGRSHIDVAREYRLSPTTVSAIVAEDT